MKDPVGKRPLSPENSMLMGALEAASYTVAGALGFKGLSALATHAASSLSSTQRESLLALSGKSGWGIVGLSAVMKAP